MIPRALLLILFFYAFAPIPPALAVEEACRPVARVFGQDFCEQELTSSMQVAAARREGPAAAPPPGRDGPEDLAARKAMLRDLIWRRALGKKYAPDVLVPTEEEIELFQSDFSKTVEASYQADKKTVEIIGSYLENRQFEDSVRRKLEELLQVTKTSVYFYEKRREQTKTVPESFQFVAAEAEKQIVTQMLGVWKEDRALFKEYGGRLAMREGRLVPVDAHRKFLEYIRAEGELSFADARYADAFAGMEAEPGAGGAIVPEGEPPYEHYFADPAWQFTLAGNDTRLDDLRKWLEEQAIPERAGE